MTSSGEVVVAATETFLLTDQTVRIVREPPADARDRVEQVALALADDLRDLIEQTHLDLTAALAVPRDDYLAESEDVAEELCDDIERMLKHRLVSAVHLLLCDPAAAHTATGERVVRYHVAYVTMSPRGGAGQRGHREPPHKDGLDVTQVAMADLAVALVLEWAPRADAQKRAQLRRPQYNFDWASPLDPPYPRTVVRFTPPAERQAALPLA